MFVNKELLPEGLEDWDTDERDEYDFHSLIREIVQSLNHESLLSIMKYKGYYEDDDFKEEDLYTDYYSFSTFIKEIHGITDIWYSDLSNILIHECNNRYGFLVCQLLNQNIKNYIKIGEFF